jgi:phosphoribosyl 1,2-cyclic phosphodiesterase
VQPELGEYMHIRCWGSRGQIPTCGPEYNKYGGDTTCLEIRSKTGDLIIIDAGSGIRHLGVKLMEEKRTSFSLLFTHLHLDHIMGFPFFAPVYDRRTSFTVYGCPFNVSSFQEALHGMMQAPYFPVDLNNLPCKIRYKDILTQSFKIGSIRIKPIMLNHPNGGLGFRLEEGDTSFVFLTDNELGYDLPGAQAFETYRDFCEGADLLIHDAEFDKEEYSRFKAWGHSRYTDAVELAIKAGVSRLGLFHINNRRTDRQVDAMVKESRRIIERRGAAVECTAIGNTYEINL